MSQPAGQHCPFLNRSDARCAGYLSLDRLGHALRHCFGQYASCATYVELLVERRARRNAGERGVERDSNAGAVQVSIHGCAVTRPSAAAAAPTDGAAHV
jgi:hypothetical protein